MRPYKTRSTRDRSITHSSLERRVSTKSSISQLLFFNYVNVCNIPLFILYTWYDSKGLVMMSFLIEKREQRDSHGARNTDQPTRKYL